MNSLYGSLFISMVACLAACGGSSDTTGAGGGGTGGAAGSGGSSPASTSTTSAGGSGGADSTSASTSDSTTSASTTSATTTDASSTSTGANESYDCAKAEAEVQKRGDALQCSDTAGGVSQFHQGCTTLAANFGACGDEFNAFVDCIVALPDDKWACDGTNRPSPLADQCQTEYAAVGACAKS